MCKQTKNDNLLNKQYQTDKQVNTFPLKQPNKAFINLKGKKKRRKNTKTNKMGLGCL